METFEFNGLYFYEGTSEGVMKVICNNLHGDRLRIWFGDKVTGKSWDEENDVCGYIGRTTGNKPISILLNNQQSSGGGAILTNCIVKIVNTKTKRVLYQHPNFSQSLFTAVGCSVLQDGDTFAPNCKSEVSAQRLADFMNGKRMSK
jgi:hypothetical protein